MTIRIEVLSSDSNIANAAFYYPIPSKYRSPLAVDQDRTPAGTRLSLAEKQQLKDGQLYELIASVNIAGKSIEDIRKTFEAKWFSLKQAAKDEYLNSYSYIGEVYDSNGNWS